MQMCGRHFVIASHYRSEQRIGGGFHYDAAKCRQDLVAQYPALRNVSFATHEFIWISPKQLCESKWVKRYFVLFTRPILLHAGQRKNLCITSLSPSSHPLPSPPPHSPQAYGAARNTNSF